MDQEEKNKLTIHQRMRKQKIVKEVVQKFLSKDQSTETLVIKGGQSTPEYTAIPVNKPKKK